MNVAEFVRRAAVADPARLAILEEGSEITYGDLWREVEALAAGVKAIGLGEGATVAILLPNGREFVFTLLALLSINAVAVPVKPQVPAADRRFMLEQSAPSALVLSTSVLDHLLSEQPDLLDGRKLILVPNRGTETRILDPEQHLDDRALFRYSQLLDSGNGERPWVPLRTGRNQPATINYTYRGYGHPLGAVLTHRQYLQGAIRYVKMSRMQPGSRHLLSLPAVHIFPLVGCILAPLLARATIVIPHSLTPRKLFGAIQESKVEVVTCVPTLYEFLARHFQPGKWDLSSIRMAICGGEPMPEGLPERVRATLGFELLEGYGLTETMPVTWNPPWANRPGTLGIPARDVTLRIVDPQGNERPQGEVGEIVLRCRSVMLGYYEAPAESKEALRDGWFYTGDYGRVDGDGYLYFCGLRKAIRKVNGVTSDCPPSQAAPQS